MNLPQRPQRKSLSRQATQLHIPQAAVIHSDRDKAREPGWRGRERGSDGYANKRVGGHNMYSVFISGICVIGTEEKSRLCLCVQLVIKNMWMPSGLLLVFYSESDFWGRKLSLRVFWNTSDILFNYSSSAVFPFLYFCVTCLLLQFFRLFLPLFLYFKVCTLLLDDSLDGWMDGVINEGSKVSWLEMAVGRTIEGLFFLRPNMVD